MKILIIGTGYIGSLLKNAWNDAVCVETHFDKPDEIRRLLEEQQPDAVVNAAGETGRPNVDWCETHQAETYLANTIGPLHLARACQERGVYLLHLSSGCIFYGQAPDLKGWKENDYANPGAFYSRTKYAADLILDKMPNVGIARLRLPVDHRPSPKNLIDKLAGYKQVIDVENSVTFVDDLIPTLRQLIERRATGTFHVVNPEPLRYRELLDAYREFVDPNHRCEWISEQDLSTRGLVAKPRATTLLQSTRLAELGITLRPTAQALRDTLIKYAAAKKNMNDISPSTLHVHVPRPKEMKGVITAGGMGTRLLPLTSITNKHLLPVYNKPIILYPLQTLLDSGVRKILLITGPEYAHQFMKLLGSGSKYNCEFSYRIQDQAGGIAQAVGMAEDFVGSDNFVVHLGDNIFEQNFLPEVSSFRSGAMNFYKHVEDPRQYGVMEVDPTGKVLSIEEKPKNPKSNFAQLGLYIYDSEVFDIIKNLKPSARGELEISETNSEYLRRGKLVAKPVNGRWFDTGTFQDLKRATEYFADKDGMK